MSQRQPDEVTGSGAQRKRRDPLVYAAPLLIAAALLVLGLIAWLARPEPAAPAMDSDGRDATTESAPATPQPQQAVPAEHRPVPDTAPAESQRAGADAEAALPASGASTSDILAQLLPRAEAGDAQAACVAAMALGRCRSQQLSRLADAAESFWVEAAARDESVAPNEAA